MGGERLGGIVKGPRQKQEPEVGPVSLADRSRLSPCLPLLSLSPSWERESDVGYISSGLLGAMVGV